MFRVTPGTECSQYTSRQRARGEASCHNLNFFSVQPLRTLCLGGETDAAVTHHRDTEYAEVAQRRGVADTVRWY